MSTLTEDGYKYSEKVMDQSLTRYYMNGLQDLGWMPFLNLRECFRYPSLDGKEIPILDELKLTVEQLMPKLGIDGKEVVAMFLNRFKTGKDRIPYHKDSYDSDVLTLSLGATRRFRIQKDSTKKSIGFDLSDGDFFYFTKEFNNNYKHSVTPTKKSVGERISVVFFLH